MQTSVTESRLLNKITGKEFLSGVTENELQAITSAYRYFGAVWVLLAKKQFADQPDLFSQTLQKAVLHISKPLWLEYILTEDGNEAFITDREYSEALPAQEQTDMEEKPAGPAEEEMLQQKLSSLLDEQTEIFSQPVDAEISLPVNTEPYYRIDYFASQGIKLEDANLQDKLGVKLRSFTDWLKQMKKINPEPADLGSDETSERIVQDAAETSNQAKEVVTEAMADVLVKQGKTQKAIEIYEKLGFLYPAKSAFFAAKIKDLKSES